MPRKFEDGVVIGSCFVIEDSGKLKTGATDDPFAESPKFASSSTEYTPAVPGDWVDPDPVEVKGALDDLAERITDLENVVPPPPAGGEFKQWPEYANTILSLANASSGLLVTDREASGSRRHYYEVSKSGGGTDTFLISVKIQLPTITTFDEVKIETYRDGTVPTMTCSLYNSSGTVDSTINGSSVKPVADTTWETITLTVGSSYSSGEEITLEFTVDLNNSSQSARLGQLTHKVTQP